MEKVTFSLAEKRREREFSSAKAALEFIRIAAEKFGEDFSVAPSSGIAPSPEGLASMQPLHQAQNEPEGADLRDNGQ